jgi:hypothetical protein
MAADGVLIARTGEEICCPECAATLVVFISDYYYPSPLPPEAVLAMQEGADAGRSTLTAFVCRCGGMPTRPLRPAARFTLREAQAPRVFVRSGDWLGWRDLGE